MRGFKILPSEIIKLQKLKTLDLQHSAIEELSENIVNLRNLENIILLYSNIKKLPKGLKEMANLKSLHLGCTKFNIIPGQLFEMTQLQKLILTNIKECADDSKVAFYDQGQLKQLKLKLQKTTIFMNSRLK